MEIERSPLDSRIWVPVDLPDPSRIVSSHAGYFMAVKAWAEECTTKVGISEGVPVQAMRWRKQSEDHYTLEIKE